MKEILLTEKKMVFLVLLYFYGPIQLDCIFMLNFILFFKFWLLNSTLWNFCFKKGTISRAVFRTLSILKIVVPRCSAYHYCTSSFNKVWTQALRRFKSCLGRVDLWQWSQLEIRLNVFRRSTIPQKQFIIIKHLRWSVFWK